jgi:tetratricopeptide (TPR) repeat protein
MPDSVLEEIERGWKLLNEGKEEEALKLVRETEKREGITQEENLKCNIIKAFLLFFFGRFEEVLILVEQAYQESMRFQRPLLSIDTLIVKWITLIQLNRFEESKEDIEKIEKFLKSSLQEPHSEVEQREALLYYMKGWFFIVEGKFDLAIVDLKKSISICERYDRLLFFIPRILSQIGTTYFNKGELKKSLKANKKCLELSKGNSIGIKIVKFWAFSNIGGIYYQQGDLDLAVDYYEKGVKTFEQDNLIMHSGEAYGKLIEIFLDKNASERVKEYLHRFQLHTEQVKSSVNTRFYELAKARILKSSTRTRDRAKAESILKELTEGQNYSNQPQYEDFYPALILLSELYFEELKLTNDNAILEDIQPLVERIIKAAKKLNSYTLQAQGFLLQGVISLLQMNMEDARRFLTQAQNIANEHGLRRLAKAISFEHDKMLEQLNKWENLNNNGAPISEVMNLASLDDIIDGMQGKRVMKAPEIVSEDPVLLLTIAEGGVLIFSHPFTDEWKRDNALFSSFLSAFTSFSDEFFSEGFDRAKFGQYTVLIEPIANFSVCYLFKGQTYLASQKLAKFSHEIQDNLSISQTLEKFYKTSQVLELKDIPKLESLITEIFTK